jgi:hypothetical protein
MEAHRTTYSMGGALSWLTAWLHVIAGCMDKHKLTWGELDWLVSTPAIRSNQKR